MTDIKVLFLSANPEDTVQLNLAKEFKAIKESIKRGKLKQNLILIHEFASNYRDVRRAIIDSNPDIIHFSGHGSKNGIYLENEKKIELVSGQTLKDLLSLFHKTKAIILNSCFSEYQGKYISEVVPITIAMTGAIKDEVAIEFSIGFYDGLSNGRTIFDSFLFARNAANEKSEKKIKEHILKESRSLDIELSHENPSAIIIINNNYKRKRTSLLAIKYLIYALLIAALTILASNTSKNFYRNAKCEYNLSLLQDRFNTLLLFYESNEGSERYPYRLEEIKTKMPMLIADIDKLPDNCLNEPYVITKYEILLFSSLIQSIIYAKEYQVNKSIRYKEDALTSTEKTIKIGNHLLGKINNSNLAAIKSDQKWERAIYNIANAYSIQEYFGIDGAKDSVEKHLKLLDSIYIQRNPLESEYFLNLHEELNNGKPRNPFAR